MIDLSSFNDVVTKTGRHAGQNSYVTLRSNSCKLSLATKVYEEIKKYIGNVVNVKVNADLSIIVLMRGNDRRVGVNRDVSLVSLKEGFKQKYGENIVTVYYDSTWDEDEHGTKVVVFRADGKKEYDTDMTIRRLNDGRA